LFKQISHVFFLRVILGLVIFITDIFFARYLGPTFKGYYYILIITPITLSFAAGLGLDYALNYFGHRHSEKLFSLFLSSILITLFSCFIFMIFIGLNLFESSDFLYKAFPIEYSNSVLISLFLIPAQAILSLIVMLAMTMGRPDLSVYFRIIRRSGLLLLVVLLYLFYKADAPSKINLLLFAQLVSFLLCFGYFHFKIRIRFSEKFYPFKPLFIEGFRAYPGRLAERLQIRIGSIIVGMLSGGTAVGLFSVALGISEIFFYVSGSAASVLFSKKISDTVSDKHLMSVRLMLPLSIFCAIGIGIVSHLLIPFVYSSAFEKCRFLVWLILPGCISEALIQTISPFLVQKGQSRIVSIGLICGLVMMIFTNILFVPKFHETGASLAYSISFIFAFFLILALSIKKNPDIKVADFIFVNANDMEIVRMAARRLTKFKFF